MKRKTLIGKYPPSKPCACEVCLAYCKRPGWWTVDEAAKAMAGGLAPRMMLEMAPDRSFGVLSPAFRGCESNFASNLFANQGCCFLKESRCELHGTGLQPLECRYCHHDRTGSGPACHADIEKEWKTPEAGKLVMKWSRETGLLDKLYVRNLETRAT